MGTEDDEGFPQDGEGPIRQVSLDPFYIDLYPVTNSQFLEFTRADRSIARTPRSSAGRSCFRATSRRSARRNWSANGLPPFPGGAR